MSQSDVVDTHSTLPLRVGCGSYIGGTRWIFLFLFGFCLAIPVAPESRLALFDLIAFGVCIAHYKFLVRSQQVRTAFLLFCLYTFWVFLSLLIHGLPLINFAFRVAPVGLTMVGALAFYKIISGEGVKYQFVLILGVVLGISMHYFYPVDPRAVELPFKFLIGIPLGIMIALLFCFSPVNSWLRKLFFSGSLIMYSGYCMFVGSRMTGGVFFVTACMVWFEIGIVRRLSYRRIFPIYLLVAFLSIYLLTESYSYLAIKGLFGDQAAGIAEFQEQFFGNILLGGRPEVAINLTALYDSPLIGQGPLSESYAYKMILYAMGIFDQSYVRDDYVLYHSMLFTAGHEAGLVAMVFWAYLIYKIAFSIPVYITLDRRLAFVALPILISGIWNILFSPLIFYNRWSLSLAIALAFIGSDRWILANGLIKAPK